MARKTYNTTPMTVSTQQLEMSYANFASFKGINNNKNYVTVDQETFSEANNVYVDNDNQLSSRPKLVSDKSYYGLRPGLRDAKLINIFKINNLVFYEILSRMTTEPPTYHIDLLVQYNNEWHDINVLNLVNWDEGYDQFIEEFSKLQVMFYNDMYVVFYKEGLCAFYWDYAMKQFDTIDDVTDVVYVPITKLVSGSTAEAYESKNVLTNREITRYLFTRVNETNTQNIVGKEVTVNIADEQFTIVFQKYNEIVFTSLQGVRSVEFTTIMNSRRGTFLAYTSDYTMYYSVDGVLFTEVPAPENLTLTSNDDISFSEEGDAIFIYKRMTGSAYSNDVIYKGTFSLESTNISNISYQAYSVGNADFSNVAYHCNSIISDTDRTMVSSSYNSGSGNNSYARVGSSFDSQTYVVLLQNVTIEQQRNTSETATGYTSGGTTSDISMFVVMIFHDGQITAISLMRTLGTINPRILSIEVNRGTNINLCTIRYTFSVSRNTGTNYTNSHYIYMHQIVLNSNFQPYYYFQAQGTSAYRKFDTYVILAATINTTTSAAETSKFTSIQQKITFDQTTNTCNIVLLYSYDGATCLSNISYVIKQADDYDTNYLTDEYTYTWSGSAWTNYGNRQSRPYITDVPISDNITVSTISVTTNSNIVIYNADIFATNNFVYYYGEVIPYLSRVNETSIIPIWCDEDKVIYYDNLNNVYSTDFSVDINVDYEIGYNHTTFIPEFISYLLNPVVSYRNKLYISSIGADTTQEHTVYFPEDKVITYEDDITNLVTFSTEALGVFLEGNIYEVTYSTSDLGTEFYSKLTKLQLGCKRGSDVMLTYDGSNVIVTNLKGMNALTYQDFKQTTDQAYTYLTENIITLYETFAKLATAGIKLYQYKNWIFMYGAEKSENLLPLSTLDKETTEGVTFYTDVDGVHMTGTSDASAGTSSMYTLLDKNAVSDRGRTYTFTAVGSTDDYGAEGYIDTMYGTQIYFHSGDTFTLDNTVNSLTIYAFCRSGKTVNDTVIKPMLVEGGVAKPYERDNLTYGLKTLYLYDLRNSSWWKWTLNHQIDQLININDELYLRSGNDLFYFDSSFTDYYDNNTEPIDWSFKSQKLHFNAPNNYKTVKSLTILASNDEEGSIVSKLKFYNYRNMMFEASDVVEYEVKQLTTFIKKVNFMKTNAFQFEISNYRDVEPCKFTTPNVAIKYRITEAVR